MKKIVLLILVAGIATYYLSGDDSKPNSYSIIGKWTDNGEKTVQSMIEGGKEISPDKAKILISTLSDTTLIITESTLGMAFASNPNPNFNITPIPYTVISETTRSVTISFQERPGKTAEKIYHFSDDGQCIYEKHSSYNIYSCKEI